MKIKTTYVVEMVNDNTDERISIVRFIGNFDKKAITECFVSFCGQSKPGYVVEYWKQDNKYAYNPLFTVENHNGELKRLIIKGEKCFYKSFDPQTLRNSIQ